MPRGNTFKAYNAYGCAFNMPLNEDVNYRIWEIMAAGSVCITEKIPERIKDEILAKNNVNIITYKNVDECCDQIRKILSNRGKRMAIAESAYNTMRNAKKNSENLKRIVNALMDKKSEIDK